MSDFIKETFEANMMLPEYKLITFTWGNVSMIDREKGLVAIKPSGVSYEGMKQEDMVVLDLDGNKVSGDYKPSSDTATHLALYKAFPNIGGIVHTHSPWATTFAQAGMSLACYGTTHADHFYGTIPCTRALTDAEIESEYELNTGNVIIETFQNLDPDAIPAVLVKNHGPFVWGKDAKDAVHNAVVLEEVAKMAARMLRLNPDAQPVPQALLDKHFLRKHGKNAYYGQ